MTDEMKLKNKNHTNQAKRKCSLYLYTTESDLYLCHLNVVYDNEGHIVYIEDKHS